MVVLHFNEDLSLYVSFQKQPLYTLSNVFSSIRWRLFVREKQSIGLCDKCEIKKSSFLFFWPLQSKGFWQNTHFWPITEAISCWFFTVGASLNFRWWKSITCYHFRINLIQLCFVKLSEVSEQIMVRSPQNCQAWETCQRCQTAVKKRDFTFGHCQEQYGWTTVEVCEDSKSSLQLERFHSTWIQAQIRHNFDKDSISLFVNNMRPKTKIL